MFNDLKYLSRLQRSFANVLFYFAVTFLVLSLFFTAITQAITMACLCLIGVTLLIVFENFKRKAQQETEYATLVGFSRHSVGFNSAQVINSLTIILFLFVVLQLNFNFIDYNLTLKLLGLR